MAVRGLLLVSACVLALLAPSEAVKLPSHKELRCSMCEIVATEVTSLVESADLKQTVLLGGRLEGGEARKKVRYARSEAHLMEVFETVCAKIPKHDSAGKKNGKWKYVDSSAKSVFDKHEEYEKKVLEKARKAADQARRDADELTADKPAEEKAEEVAATIEEGTPEDEKEEELVEPPKSPFNSVVTSSKLRKSLTNGCRDLVEKVEDDMTEFLHDNWSEDLNVRHQMCEQLTNLCKAAKNKAKKPKEDL